MGGRMFQAQWRPKAMYVQTVLPTPNDTAFVWHPSETHRLKCRT
jgi:hypothetical protein